MVKPINSIDLIAICSIRESKQKRTNQNQIKQTKVFAKILSVLNNYSDIK